jgi:hypothetical protein
MKSPSRVSSLIILRKAQNVKRQRQLAPPGLSSGSGYPKICSPFAY